MVYPAQSIYAGTWGSGTGPIEVEWAELMQYYAWSWQDYQATPRYVRRALWDMMLAKRDAQRAAEERGG